MPEGQDILQHPSCLPGLLHPADSEKICCHLGQVASCDHPPVKCHIDRKNKITLITSMIYLFGGQKSILLAITGDFRLHNYLTGMV